MLGVHSFVLLALLSPEWRGFTPVLNTSLPSIRLQNNMLMRLHLFPILDYPGVIVYMECCCVLKVIFKSIVYCHLLQHMTNYFRYNINCSVAVGVIRTVTLTNKREGLPAGIHLLLF